MEERKPGIRLGASIRRRRKLRLERRDAKNKGKTLSVHTGTQEHTYITPNNQTHIVRQYRLVRVTDAYGG
jgi:predicted N-acyltransferase